MAEAKIKAHTQEKKTRTVRDWSKLDKCQNFKKHSKRVNDKKNAIPLCHLIANNKLVNV